MPESAYVYILTNQRNTTLYVGVTSNLKKRMYEHKAKLVTGFTRYYNLNKLVYYEQADCVTSAIQREKQLKGWLRIKKVGLIETTNPSWDDLSLEFMR